LSEHPYGAWILLPPLVAFSMAIVTKRVVLSLVVGIFAGALMMAGGNPFVALYQTWETHLWPTLADPGKLRVYSFTIFMGAMVGVVTISGGMRSLIGCLIPFASNRRRGQLAAWLMGMVIFFDDYASTILLGSTMRSLFDRLRISRAKLAYIVDSTSAPTASLALISTWIAVEVDYISDGLVASGIDGTLAFEAFVYSIPYRFYVLTSLVLVPITVIMQRDLGAMHAAEATCVATKYVEEDDQSDATSVPQYRYSWLFAVVPIFAMLGVVVVALYVTGLQNLAEQTAARGTVDLAGMARIRQIIGAASSSVSLQYGALVGLAFAMGLPLLTRTISLAKLNEGAASGIRIILPAVAVLWTASTLSRMTTDRSVNGEVETRPYQFQDHRLYAADYLTRLFSGDPGNPVDGNAANKNVDPTSRQQISTAVMPTISFVIAAIVAFCTGTSYGTMGIILPMVIPLVCGMLSLNGDVSLSDPILLATIAGVLSGAVFGDHCSPISDTTILSSQSSGCDHLTHVWTQAPYAALAAVTSIAIGTVPIGFGVSVWYLLPTQVIAMIACTRIFGRKTSDP